MADFGDLFEGEIPDRVPSAPEEDIEPLESEPELPHDTRAQRRAIKSYAITQMKGEGCTCREPFPKITFIEHADDMPEGAVPFTSRHERMCTWILRHNAGSN